MPHLYIETNLPRSKIPHDFVTKVVPVLAQTLGRPEQLCAVTIVPDIPMSFGGSTELCAIAKVQAIGVFGVDQNKKYSDVFFKFIEKELGVPSDRMYMQFQDVSLSNVGYKGSTFHFLDVKLN